MVSLYNLNTADLAAPIHDIRDKGGGAGRRKGGGEEEGGRGGGGTGQGEGGERGKEGVGAGRGAGTPTLPVTTGVFFLLFLLSVFF